MLMQVIATWLRVSHNVGEVGNLTISDFAGSHQHCTNLLTYSVKFSDFPLALYNSFSRVAMDLCGWHFRFYYEFVFYHTV